MTRVFSFRQGWRVPGLIRVALLLMALVALLPRSATTQETSSSRCASPGDGRDCYDQALEVLKTAVSQASQAASEARGAAEDSATARVHWQRAVTVLEAPGTRRALGEILHACRNLSRGEACHTAGMVAQASALARLTLAEDPSEWDRLLRPAADLFREGCLAEEVSAAACVELGDAYLFGLGRVTAADSALQYYDRGCGPQTAAALSGQPLEAVSSLPGSPTACFRSVRYRPGYYSAINPVRDVWIEAACLAGSQNACVSFAYWLEEDLHDREVEFGTSDYLRDRERVMGSYLRTCESGILIGCNNYGSLWIDGKLGLPVNIPLGLRYLEWACSGIDPADSQIPADTLPTAGESAACQNLGDVYLSGVLDSAGETLLAVDSARAVRYWDQGCESGDADLCATLASLKYNGFGENRFVYLFRVATTCHEGSGYGCYVTGWVYENILDEVVRAEQYYRRGCEIGSDHGCHDAAALVAKWQEYGRPEGYPADPNLQVLHHKYLRRGCELEDGASCRELADLLPRSTDADRGELLRLACTYGDADGCSRTASLSRDDGDRADEARLRSLACHLDSHYCKLKP